MSGTRIKRSEAEAMFPDFLAGMTWEDIARKHGRDADRIRALAKREGWDNKVAEAHEERLRRMARAFVKEDERNIQAVIAARNMMAEEMREDWDKKRGSRVPESRRIETLLKAVSTLDDLLGTLTGRDKAAPTVQVDVHGENMQIALLLPAEVAALAKEREHAQALLAKPVEVQIGEETETRALGSADGADQVYLGPVLPRHDWECLHTFRSAACGYAGEAQACSGTFDDCKAKGNQARYGGRPMTPEERDANQRSEKDGGAA